MSVGKAVLRVRQQRGLTQGEVARRAGLATSYVSRIENNHVQPTMTTLTRLADALEISVSRLFESSEQRDSASSHGCPVSASGQCIGEMIRSERGKRPRSKPGSYGAEELRLLKMADYLALHGSKELRRSLTFFLEALMGQTSKRPHP